MQFINQIIYQLQNRDGNAFCIGDRYYTYKDLGNVVSIIAEKLEAKLSLTNKQRIAILCTDHLNTYASILACWIRGYTYIPLGLNNPHSRNLEILHAADISLILSTQKLEEDIYNEYNIIDISFVNENIFKIPCSNDINYNNIAYILFTSGSTGIPKGVPISYGNLETFIVAFQSSPVIFEKTDKCLQMYDLTFDLSISSFLVPLIAGACIYTVTSEGIKYINVLKTINKYRLTILQIVPSIIKLGSPLLSRLDFSFVKYCILGGEATTYDILEKIQPLMPKTRIYNYYGPTEATIYCAFYLYNSKYPKLYNGMLAIGKPLGNTTLKIVDPITLKTVMPFEKGELLIEGDQLTEGYLNDLEKNKEAFVYLEIGKSSKRFYRSGDMCYVDDEDDIFYCGRFDNQIKIQGFRIELSEIEHKVLKNFGINNIAVPYVNKANATEIILVIEETRRDKNETLLEQLKSELPIYMIPKRIIKIKELPINSSGKTDRVKLSQFVKENYG